MPLIIVAKSARKPRRDGTPEASLLIRHDLCVISTIDPVKSGSRNHAAFVPLIRVASQQTRHSTSMSFVTETQDGGSPPLIRWISPFRARFMILRRLGTKGRRSANRFDLARRIRNRDAPAREILLVFQSFIHGHEDLEAVALREIEQGAVLLARKSCFPIAPEKERECRGRLGFRREYRGLSQSLHRYDSREAPWACCRQH